jgi:SAM-dependent methyltransferase
MTDRDPTAKAQASIWNTVAAQRQHLVSQWSDALWETVLDRVAAGPGVRLLDVGCGSGEAAVRASTRGATVAGLDNSEAMIEECRRKLPSGDFRVGDMQQLPWPDGHFDAIISCNAVHFTSRPDRAFAQMRRVIRAGGTLAVSSNGPRAEYPAADVLDSLRAALTEPVEVADPHALAEGDILDRLVAGAGFHVIDSVKVPFPHIYKNVEAAFQMAQVIGVTRILLDKIGEAKGREILKKVFARYTEPDGRVAMHNIARAVIGRAAQT